MHPGRPRSRRSGSSARLEPQREQSLGGAAIVVRDEHEKVASVRKLRPQRHPLEVELVSPQPSCQSSLFFTGV